MTKPGKTDIDPVPAKRKKRGQTRPVSPENLLCHVCEDQAGKHSYYGAQACNSCRAFFRRAVESEYCFAYFCLKDKQCTIDQKSRKKCQYCRYQACLAAGMKTSWVKNEEDKKRFSEIK